MPARTITASEVNEFLLGSIYTKPLTHRTFGRNVESILLTGFRVENSGPVDGISLFDGGLWKSSFAEAWDSIILVAVHSQNPLLCANALDIRVTAMDRGFDVNATNAELRASFLAAGYDSIKCADGVVVALDPTKIAILGDQIKRPSAP